MLGHVQRQSQRQTLKLGARQLQGVKLLAMSLPELRAEIAAEMSANPAIEDYDHPLETPLSAVEARCAAEERIADYPEDDFVPGISRDEEAAERRQALFDNQVREETLQAHLAAQLPLSEVEPADWQLAEVLIGDLNDDGFYIGSLADAAMAFGKTEAEVLAVLSHIGQLDPPGCGARTAAECLRYQLAASPDLAERDLARQIVDGRLPLLAERRYDELVRSLGVERQRVMTAVKTIRSLSPHPARAYPGERSQVEYVNPEIHAVREGGEWVAKTDRRSLPEIRISERFRRILADPNADAETKAYVRERIAAAKALVEAVAKRQETVSAIADAVFARQQEFFRRGFAALKPLTESEVAKETGVSVATVSRTVRDKYASTPQGTVELRRFFVAGVRNAAGELVAQAALLQALKDLVEGEDAAAPLSDARLAELLSARGFQVARRTVAKYRDQLGIPCAAERGACG